MYWYDSYKSCRAQACPTVDKAHAPELVTLANFESKASLLAEQATIHSAGDPGSLESEADKKYSCAAVPAAWNRNVLAAIDPESPEETLNSEPSATGLLLRNLD